MNMKTKIILYESQLLYAESLHCLLSKSRFTTSCEVITVNTKQEAMNQVTDPGTIIFFNISPLTSHEVGNEIEQLLELNPSLKIITYSAFPEPRMIKRIFDKGAKGFLGNNTTGREFLEALECMLEDKVYINENAKNALLNYICSVEDAKPKHSSVEELTAREKDVLHLICEGLRSREIAERLFISTHTVESHRRNMMLKFNINSSNQLVKYALENRLVEY